MKTVREVMEPVTATLRLENTLAEAVKKMRAAPRGGNRYPGVKGMLVLGGDGGLLGMVSVMDILRTVVPSYMELSEVGHMSWPGMLEEMADKVRNKPVSEIMSRNLTIVSPATTLMECAELMVKNEFQRLPVVEGGGTLLGMVYVRDLHYAIAAALFGEDEEESRS